MTANPYERLADTLNRIPNGFTHIEDGTHLRILEWIFSPEEADLASKMKLRGETVDELAERLDIPVEGLQEKLEAMAKKGQIYAWNSDTGRLYALMVFIGGVWENQGERMDTEFAQLVEDYFSKGRGVGHFDTEPAVFRVIPVNKAMTPKLEVYPFEVAENLIERSKAWGLRECMCRKQKRVLGQECEYPLSVCLTFSSRLGAYDEDDLTQSISKEESLEILRQAEEAGLIHCAMNVQQGQSYICNCCTCCCAMLGGLVNLGQPHAFVKSNYIAGVDPYACTGCGECVGRCQFQALSLQEDLCEVEPSHCVGCGVCSMACPEDAITLHPREAADRTTPPESRVEWNRQKAASRGLDMSDLL